MRNKMNGRTINKWLLPLNKSLTALLKIIPKFLRVIMYDILRFIPTKIGVYFRQILVSSLCKTGNNLYIAANVTIKGFSRLELGNNVSFHENCYIDAQGGVYIGNDVSIAHGSSIISFEHTWSDPTLSIKYNPLENKAVHIGSDIWVGCGARILGGSYLSDRTIVAASCVVNSKYPSNVLLAGVPSQMIKEI